MFNKSEVKEGQHQDTHRTKQESTAKSIISNRDGKMNRNVQFAQEKVASIWLTAVPLEKNSFALNKSEFKDATALWYG